MALKTVKSEEQTGDCPLPWEGSWVVDQFVQFTCLTLAGGGFDALVLSLENSGGEKQAGDWVDT